MVSIIVLNIEAGQYNIKINLAISYSPTFCVMKIDPFFNKKKKKNPYFHNFFFRIKVATSVMFKPQKKLYFIIASTHFYVTTSE